MTSTASHTYEYSFGLSALVRASSLFSAESGFGFVDQRSVAGATTAEQALHNGGWNCRRAFSEHWNEALAETASGVYVKDARAVLIFKAAVASYGVYRVTVRVKAPDAAVSDMALFCGRRSAIVRNVQLEPHEERAFTFYAVSAPYIPAFASAEEKEAALYISVSGEHAGFSHISIEKADARVLWVAGDSTLTDQNALFPYYPAYSCGGWAQALPRYLHDMAVCNYAHSGMTTNCFRDDGHWRLITAHAKKGDAVLFQFGHNDQKRRNLSAFGGYSTNLRRYVREAREAGLVPLIASPISRIPFEDNGKARSLLADYALAAAKVADELQVPFIDLHGKTFAHWNAVEHCKNESALQSASAQKPHAAAKYFMSGDITHTNDIGADLIASFVAQEIREKHIEMLESHLAPTPAPFQPADSAIPPKEAESASIFDIEIPYLDAGDGNTRETIERAFKGGLLDPCVLFVHPHSFMPRAQLLMPLFKALRLSGKRPYLASFDDISRYEWDSGYIQACLDAHLLEEPSYADESPALFLPDEPSTAGYLALLAIRGLEADAPRRLLLTADECLKRAQKLNIVPDGISAEKALTRAECYAGLVRIMELLNNEHTALPGDVEQHPTV